MIHILKKELTVNYKTDFANVRYIYHNIIKFIKK